MLVVLVLMTVFVAVVSGVFMAVVVVKVVIVADTKNKHKKK